MAKLATLLGLLRQPAVARQVMAMGVAGYLVDTGWTASVQAKSPVDAGGRPVPWVTLPFIDFIGERLRIDMNVFEFGSGASTHYYAARVGRVDSVEHDKAWFDRVAAGLPNAVRVILVPLDRDGKYAGAVTTWGERYSLIVVDGRDRVNCMRASLPCLADDGCLVLDDSERAEYADGCQWLASSGYRRLDFWGLAPGLGYRKCTSVFYRPANCLSI
jgi:hypothetical protein